MKEAKPKKAPKDKLRTPAKSLNFAALEPAIVDGTLVVTKDQTLVLKRARDYEMITLCRVVRTYPDGDVALWDETMGQWFIFNLTRDPKMVDHLRVYDKSRVGKVVFAQEASDDVPVDTESHVGTLLDDEGSDSDEFAVGVEDPTT